ncbi:MAG: orotidine-5'-phosphate decarboxylase, partial [Parvibaculales bacterium]
TLLIGVSVLTSLEAADTEAQVLAFAKTAERQGLDGIVCSGKELPIIRKNISTDFLCITPGIRPKSENSHDQKRTTTPQQAIEMGADILVIGRAITAAPNPAQAAQTIWEEIKPLCK